jgi:hypothetical protein
VGVEPNYTTARKLVLHKPFNTLWLATSLAYPSGEEGVFYLFKRRLSAYASPGGGGGQRPLIQTNFYQFFMLENGLFAHLDMYISTSVQLTLDSWGIISSYVPK